MRGGLSELLQQICYQSPSPFKPQENKSSREKHPNEHGRLPCWGYHTAQLASARAPQDHPVREAKFTLTSAAISDDVLLVCAAIVATGTTCGTARGEAQLCRRSRSDCRSGSPLPAWSLWARSPAHLLRSAVPAGCSCSPAPLSRFYMPWSGAGGSSRPGGAGCPQGQPHSGPPLRPPSPFPPLSCLWPLLAQCTISKSAREVWSQGCCKERSWERCSYVAC